MPFRLSRRALINCVCVCVCVCVYTFPIHICLTTVSDILRNCDSSEVRQNGAIPNEELPRQKGRRGEKMMPLRESLG